MNADSELAFFCLLVKQGSLAATARELNLTPPAVSRRLSIVAALPEVAPGQVEVSVEAGNLVLRGERPLPPMCRQAQIRQLEIPYGRFERRMPLPAGRFEVLGKNLSNGCFVLNLRRSGPGASP